MTFYFYIISTRLWTEWNMCNARKHSKLINHVVAIGWRKRWGICYVWMTWTRTLIAIRWVDEYAAQNALQTAENTMILRNARSDLQTIYLDTQRAFLWLNLLLAKSPKHFHGIIDLLLVPFHTWKDVCRNITYCRWLTATRCASMRSRWIIISALSFGNHIKRKLIGIEQLAMLCDSDWSSFWMGQELDHHFSLLLLLVAITTTTAHPFVIQS